MKWLLKHLTAWALLKDACIHIYGHGKHVETGYQVQMWCASLGPYDIDITPSSGNGDPEHLQWLWCCYESTWQLQTCCKTPLIYAHMDMGNMWNMVTMYGVHVLDHTGIPSHQHLGIMIQNTYNGCGAVMKALGSFRLIAKHSYIHIWT